LQCSGRPHISASPVYTDGSLWYIGVMDRLASAKIDKTAFSVGSLRDPSDEKAYWLSKTPQERLQALELMRQIVYGYDPATTRLQRVFEVARGPRR
jgi:hypothetical protein